MSATKNEHHVSGKNQTLPQASSGSVSSSFYNWILGFFIELVRDVSCGGPGWALWANFFAKLKFCISEEGVEKVSTISVF